MIHIKWGIGFMLISIFWSIPRGTPLDEWQLIFVSIIFFIGCLLLGMSK